MPIALLIILIDAIASDIENLCLEQEINDDRQVIEYLEGGTLVGLLPAPHPILIRKFAFNDGVRIWFLSFIWVSLGGSS